MQDKTKQRINTASKKGPERWFKGLDTSFVRGTSGKILTEHDPALHLTLNPNQDWSLCIVGCGPRDKTKQIKTNKTKITSSKTTLMGIYSWGRVTEAYITLLQQYYFKQNNSHFTTVPIESLSPVTSFPVLLLTQGQTCEGSSDSSALIRAWN